MKALVDEMATAYDDPEQVVNFYYSNNENLKQIEALAVEEQVAEKLLESAKLRPLICHMRTLEESSKLAG